MKNSLLKIALVSSVIVTSNVSLAEVKHSLGGNFLSVNKNKVDTFNVAPFGGGSLDILVKAEAGLRYAVTDNLKLGGGLKNTYNFVKNDEGNDNFNDVSVVAQARYKTGDIHFIQLDVSKSLTEKDGVGATLKYGILIYFLLKT